MNYLSVAQDIVKRAGAMLLKHRDEDFDIETKMERSDYVTTADKEIEKYMVSELHNQFPDHTIIGEEFGENTGDGKFTWRVDPIDGTSNFVHHLPHSTVVLSLENTSEVLLGVVYDPFVDELFFAERGQGSYMNKKKLHVSPIDSLAKSCVIFNPDWRRKETCEANIKLAEKLYRGVETIPNFGSAALHMCYVACGRAEGYVGMYVDPYSMNAGKIILEEAGGKMTDARGDTWSMHSDSSIISNHYVHEELLKVCSVVYH
ncbi:inositol monophosphatase [Candidatus Woesebacteria bacterium]|nr:inositol monophosphatase [Candidatus Woesebacteria bacterium]